MFMSIKSLLNVKTKIENHFHDTFSCVRSSQLLIYCLTFYRFNQLLLETQSEFNTIFHLNRHLTRFYRNST